MTLNGLFKIKKQKAILKEYKSINTNGGIVMKKILTNKSLMILTIVAVLGFGAYAFADWGMGPGMMGGWGHHGPGWHHGGYGYNGNGNMMENFSDNEIQEMNLQRNKFFKETENLRQDLYARQLELRSELSKENPDSKRASSLQNDISKLQTQLDQKRIDHMVDMRKINPNAGRGFMGRGGMGYGAGPGSYCWR
jgi:Spy/CpxP family protein refolding chaperone